MLDILIPTYGRAHKIARIVSNVKETTPIPYKLWFCIEADDQYTWDAVNDHGLTPIVNNHTRNYSGAINSGYDQTSEPYIFCGADDLEFTLGWANHGIEMFRDPWLGVVGTIDGVNPYVNAGTHATHYFVRRSYIDKVGGIVDQGPGTVLYEGYRHNYTDTEFIATAKMRAKFHPCFDSHVRHRHWSTAGGDPADHVQEVANAHYQADSDLYDSRRDLWFSISR